MKIFSYILCAAVITTAVGVAYFYLHTTVLSRKSLQDIEVTERNNNQHITVHLEGSVVGGMLAVSRIDQSQNGACIVVLARAGIARPGLRNARFNYDLNIPDDDSEISFGSPTDIIWRRNN